MKRILFAVIILAGVDALACDRFTREYGAATTIPFCLHTTNADVGAAFNKAAVHASGDTYITKNEGAEANTTNAFVDEGSCYSIALTATEMQAARVMLHIDDQTSPKAWADKCVVIETVNNASAQFPTPSVNLTDGAVTAAKFAANAITSTVVADGTVTAPKIATGAITADKLATDALSAAAVSAAAATKIGNEAVGGGGGTTRPGL